MALIYLLHFSKPISDNHTTQHYIGYTNSLKRRLAEHKSGRGARLVEVAQERGIEFEVSRTWSKGTRAKERKLKNLKNAPMLCPVCNKGAMNRGIVE